MMQNDTTLDTCDLCGSIEVCDILFLPEPCLSSDGRLYDFPLHKVRCLHCGLIRTAGEVPQNLLDKHYGENYQLGLIGAAAEPVFFENGQKIPASESMFEWIAGAYRECGLRIPRSMLEIGCGNGALLSWLSTYWGGVHAVGIDLDPIATASASNKGIKTRVCTLEDIVERFDLVVSVAVIEHVRSPVEFLTNIKLRLNLGGAAVIILPVQDGGNRDILFWDHLYHFYEKQFSALATRCGFRIVSQHTDHPQHCGYALNILIPDSSIAAREVLIASDVQSVHEVIREWTAIFRRLDNWLEIIVDQKLTVYGLGETFDVLRAYSRLRTFAIAEGLDDNLARALARARTYPVHEASMRRLVKAEALLLTFNPPAALRKILNRLQIPVFHLDGE